MKLNANRGLTQRLLARPPPCPTHTHSRPPRRLSLCSIMPPCASTPRPHKNMSPAIQKQASMGLFVVFVFSLSRLIRIISPHLSDMILREMQWGIFFRSSCQLNIKSLHTQIIIGVLNLHTHWMNGAFQVLNGEKNRMSLLADCVECSR